MNDLSRSLRELPELPPPADGWSRLAESLDARQRQRRRRRQWAGGLALAASVLLAVVGLRPLPDPARPAPQVGGPDPVAGLMLQSQALEQRLSALKSETGVWNGAQASTAATLQRDVALLDVQLSDLAFEPVADRRAAEALWQRRVGLLNQLVSAHEASTLVQSTTAEFASDAADDGAVLEL